MGCLRVLIFHWPFLVVNDLTICNAYQNPFFFQTFADGFQTLAGAMWGPYKPSQVMTH